MKAWKTLWLLLSVASFLLGLALLLLAVFDYKLKNPEDKLCCTHLLSCYPCAEPLPPADVWLFVGVVLLLVCVAFLLLSRLRGMQDESER